MSDNGSKMILPPPFHMGIAVRNLDEAVDYYSKTFGFGPFQRLELDFPNCLVKGKPTHNVLRAAEYQWGPITFDPMEVIKGDFPQRWFLEEKGEGIHHLGFKVDDCDKWLSYFKDRGWEVVFYLNQEYPEANLRVRVGYVESSKRGFVFEFVEIKQLNKK